MTSTYIFGYVGTFDFATIITGCDCMSDEDGFPFCAFAHDDAIKCLHRLFERNKNFGLRLHAGESVKRGSSATSFEHRHLLVNYGAHVSILFCDIRKIRAKVPGLRMRLGHGIAFLMQPGVIECPAFFDDRSVFPAFHSETFNVNLKDMREFFKNPENPIAIELNMESNLYLMQDTFLRTQRACDIRLVLRQMLRDGLTVVLSTDNDGIWPCDDCGCAASSPHHSVAHEFCKAIQADCFDSASEFMKVVAAGNDTRFGP